MKTGQNGHWYSQFVGKPHGTTERDQFSRSGRLRSRNAQRATRDYELLPRRGDRR